MIATKIGERLYEFNCVADVSAAREIYVKTVGDQNSFETKLEDAGIDFTLDFC